MLSVIFWGVAFICAVATAYVIQQRRYVAAGCAALIALCASIMAYQLNRMHTIVHYVLASDQISLEYQDGKVQALPYQHIAKVQHYCTGKIPRCGVSLYLHDGQNLKLPQPFSSQQPSSQQWAIDKAQIQALLDQSR